LLAALRLGQVILDDEHNLINIWDMFSMQDELMYGPHSAQSPARCLGWAEL